MGVDILLVGTRTSNVEGQVEEANIRPWILDDPDRIVVFEAAIALAAMGKLDEGILLRIRQALFAPDEDLREYAAFVIGGTGLHAASAVPELRRLLGDSFPALRPYLK